MTGSPKIPKGIVNGPLHKAAHYATGYLNVPPNLHRLYNALGLTAGVYLGRKLMDIITGQTIDGKPVDKDDLPAPLKPLHGLLPYDHFSDKPHDRWMKVFDMMVPGVFAGIGAAGGSVFFFRDKFFKDIGKQLKLPAEKLLLTEAEQVSLHHISKPWSVMSGTAAVFGSASGFGLFPSPVNYSSTLSTTFSLRSGRTMAAPGLRRLFNSHSDQPFRLVKLLGEWIDYSARNPSASPEKMESFAYGILKPLFKDKADHAHVKAFVNEVMAQRNAFLENGHLPEHAEAKVKEALKKTIDGLGLEKTLIKIGLDPREAAVGDVGFVTTIGNLMGDFMGMGTSKKMEATRGLMREGMEMRHPELKEKFPLFNPKKPHYSDTAMKKAAAVAFLGTGAATVGLIATGKDASIHGMESSHVLAPNVAPPDTKPSEHKHLIHSKRKHGFVNGSLLDTAEGVTGMLSAGMGMHRVHCAAGLTAGTWLGDKVMEALTGVNFQGAHVPQEKVLAPLRKLYKTLAYNPKSDMPHDKWMQILRWAVPAVLGALAVAEGSKMFFNDRKKTLKHATYLDEVEDKATDAESKPWSATAAIVSVLGFPTGLTMLPLTSYSTHLGTRFSMASGRKVSLPIVGKYWSNNSTLFPFGPPGMLNLIITDAVNNKSYDPELLETYAIGVLKPWFKNVTPEQIEAFVMKVHEVRDKFFKDGGVPENLKAQLETELKAHFKGAGLEETLRDIGLDPLKAELGSNGISGAIAGALGAKKTVDKIKADYAASYRERLHKHETDDKTPLR